VGRRSQPTRTRVRRSNSERRQIAAGWAGILAFAALLTLSIRPGSYPVWRKVQRQTNSEYILRHHQGSTGIYSWSLAVAIVLGLVAYLLIVPKLPSARTTSGKARIAAATVLTVSNILFLVFTLGSRKRGYSFATTTAEKLTNHGVDYETAHLLQSVVHAALATLIALAVAGVGIQAGLHKLPGGVRLGLALLVVPAIAWAASLVFARPYLS
jgi:hypothetical protein